MRRGCQRRVRPSSIAPRPTTSWAPASCPWRHLRKAGRPVAIGLATDVGGGTSYSMLATLGETYKVQMLTGYKPSALELFFMATRGNAERLHLGHETGAHRGRQVCRSRGA